MLNKKHVITAVTGLSLVLGHSLMANAVEVEGYAKSSDGAAVTSGSGDCVRTQYKDTSEMLEECGYKRVTEKAAAIETESKATAVTIVETSGIVKDDKVVAVTGVVVEQVVINNVEFGFDSAELTDEYKAELDAASDMLKPHRELLRSGVATLNVVGYTDSRGADAYNQALSERRAKAVADYLIAQVPSRASFTKVIGRGEADPIASNDTADGRRQNRRVVLEVVGK